MRARRRRLRGRQLARLLDPDQPMIVRVKRALELELRTAAILLRRRRGGNDLFAAPLLLSAAFRGQRAFHAVAATPEAHGEDSGNFVSAQRYRARRLPRMRHGADRRAAPGAPVDPNRYLADRLPRDGEAAARRLQAQGGRGPVARRPRLRRARFAVERGPAQENSAVRVRELGRHRARRRSEQGEGRRHGHRRQNLSGRRLARRA